MPLQWIVKIFAKWLLIHGLSGVAKGGLLNGSYTKTLCMISVLSEPPAPETGGSNNNLSEAECEKTRSTINKVTKYNWDA